jgi:hypothetical protein
MEHLLQDSCLGVHLVIGKEIVWAKTLASWKAVLDLMKRS